MADLSIAEAAIRLGISKQAMRTRVRRGQVVAHKGADGAWLVTISDDICPVVSDSPLSYDADAVIAMLREQLAVKDRQLAERAREVQELHIMLQSATRQLPATIMNAPHAPERSAEDESPLCEATTSPEPLQRPQRASWWRRFFLGEQ